jgi:hypothetical protein
VQVTPNRAQTKVTGNYGLEVDFGSAKANLQSFASGSVSSSAHPNAYNLYVAHSQLFQFVLAASDHTAPSGTVLRMDVLNSKNKVVFSLTAPPGDTTSAPALFLTPGAYTVQFTASTPSGVSATTVSYNLLGEDTSDPIGPTLNDPTLTPLYTSPTLPNMFVYPGGITTPKPYLLVHK